MPFHRFSPAPGSGRCPAKPSGQESIVDTTGSECGRGNDKFGEAIADLCVRVQRLTAGPVSISARRDLKR